MAAPPPALALLNDADLSRLPPDQQQVQIFQWLRTLERQLATVDTAALKAAQPEVEKRMLAVLVNHKPTRPVRELLGRCLVPMYARGDTRGLADAVTAMQNLLKAPVSKDPKKETPLQPRLGAAYILGALGARFGRQTLLLFPETVALLLKLTKAPEVALRVEALHALGRLVDGTNRAASDATLKDIFKSVRTLLADKSGAVQVAAAECIHTQLRSGALLLSAVDVEGVLAACFKALDGSTYPLRKAVAQLVGYLLSSMLQAAKAVDDTEAATSSPAGRTAGNKKPAASSRRARGESTLTSEEMLTHLGQAFVKASGREARAGIAEAHIALVQHLGRAWANENINALLSHWAHLCSHPKCTGTIPDELLVRACAAAALRSTFGRMLNETGQATAAGHLAALIKKGVSELGTPTPSAAASRSALAVALTELGNLVRELDGSAVAVLGACVEAATAASGHPSHTVREAAAWVFRSFGQTSAISMPGLLSSLLATVTRTAASAVSPEAVARFKGAVSALVAVLVCAPARSVQVDLGLVDQVFSVAMGFVGGSSAAAAGPTGLAVAASGVAGPEPAPTELDDDLTAATARIESGWKLLKALTLSAANAAVVQPHVDAILGAMRAHFASKKDAPAKSDAELRHLTHVREAALACLQTMLTADGDLILSNAERTKRAAAYCTAAVATFGTLPASVAKTTSEFGLRRTAFACLAKLPMASYEGSAAGVLRLAAETLVNATATLADGGVATTSLTRSLCNHRDGSVAGWTPDIDDAALEDWIAAPYPSALEWDTVAMFAAGRDTVHQSVGPAPETAAVDAAVTVLGTLFPATPAATQETVVETLLKAVKATKFGSTKRAATQANIVTALLAVLRTVTGPGRKGAVGKGKVLTGIQELLQVPLILNDPAQRVAAAEAMGRLATAMGASFITSLLKSLLDTILNNQDASTRAGYILALGCVLRHVGGTGVSAHLQSTIGILTSLCSDANPLVHTYALHSLYIVVESAGLMFQPYVNSILALVAKLFHSDAHALPSDVSDTVTPVYESYGRLLSLLLATLGPEIRSSTNVRQLCLNLYDELKQDRDPRVAAEALPCAQQLLVFAPELVNIRELLPELQAFLATAPPFLRSASLTCLRQLAQQQPAAMMNYGETVEEQLFAQMDAETDLHARAEFGNVINDLANVSASARPSMWINLIRTLLSARGAAESGGEEETAGGTAAPLPLDAAPGGAGRGGLDDNDEGGGDDDTGADGGAAAAAAPTKPAFSASKSSAPSRYSLAVHGGTVRWHTRVFSVELLDRIIVTLAREPMHVDLARARRAGKLAAASQRAAGRRGASPGDFGGSDDDDDDDDDDAGGVRATMAALGAGAAASPAKAAAAAPEQTDWLVLRLSDLIRMTFNASTAAIEPLRLAGFQAVQDLVLTFGPMDDPDYEDHSLLEQYQAQIVAALRPAFAPDTPAAVMSQACRLCALYITCGVGAETADQTRTLRLLLSVFDRASRGGPAATTDVLASNGQFSQQETVVLELSALSAWAEIAVAQATPRGAKLALPSLVAPYLENLGRRWVEALSELAYLRLPVDVLATVSRSIGSGRLPVGAALLASRDVLLPRYNDVLAKFLSATMTLPRRQLVDALAGGGATAPAETNDGQPERLAVVLSLVLESLYNAGREPSAALLGLEALAVFLHADVTGTAFLKADVFRELMTVLSRVVQSDSTPLFDGVLKLLTTIVEQHGAAYLARPDDDDDSSGNVAAPGPKPTKLDAVVKVLIELIIRHQPAVATAIGVKASPARVPKADVGPLMLRAVDVFHAVLRVASLAQAADLAPLYYTVLAAALSDADVTPATATALLASMRGWLQTVHASAVAAAGHDATSTASVSALADAHRAFLGCLFAHVDDTRPAVVRSAVLASVVATTAAPQLALADGVQQAHVASLRSALAHSHDDVRIVALQGIRSLLLIPPFAAQLVPDVAALLRPSRAGDGATVSLAAGQEAVKVLAALVTSAPTDVGRAGAMGVAVPVLVGALSKADGSVATGPLPDACVQAILQFGPAQPALFKDVVARLPPADRARLEAAIRQAAAASGSGRGRPTPAAAPVAPTRHAASVSAPAAAAAAAAAPSIQLSMAFANFS